MSPGRGSDAGAVSSLHDSSGFFVDVNRFRGVSWIDVSSDSTARADLKVVADRLGVQTDSNQDVLRALSNQSEEWLLVLDNADDDLTDYSVYLPPGIRGPVLMTSRNDELASKCSLAGS